MVLGIVSAASVLTGLEAGFLTCAFAVYMGAAFVGLGVVAGRRRGRALQPMLLVGLLAMSLLMISLTWREMRPPWLNRFGVVVTATWMLAVVVWASRRRMDATVHAALAGPTLCLLTLFALLTQPITTDAGSIGFGRALHIVLALFGFVGFTVAAGVGALYLWQIRLLKKTPVAAAAVRLPPLERLDRLNFLSAAIGFPFLALSVIAGWLFVAGESNWWLDPTVLVTIGGLLIYAVLFLSRGFLGWYGRRIAWLSVLGFIVAVVGFVVAHYCTSGNAFHGS